MTIETLLTRASTARLAPPIPGEDDLDRILRAALRAPDHGALRHWRFLVIAGRGLDRLADLGAECLRHRQPDATEADLERARDKLTRVPMVIAIGARIDAEHRKIPELEQILSVGASAMNLLNALHALGYAGKWVTGPNTYDARFAEGLGFTAPERCFGMIMIGTSDGTETPAEHELDQFVRRWI